MAQTKDGRQVVIGGMSSLTDDRSSIRGVYANYPAMSPKYNTSAGAASLVDTQARLFVVMTKPQYAAWLKSIGSARAKKLAAVLGVVGKRTREGFSATASASEGGVGYVDFALQSISYSRQERFQVHETLADGYAAYFMGTRPVQLTLTGIVLNTQQDGWYDAMHLMYEHVLRGTRMAADRRAVWLRADTRLYRGSIVGDSMSFTAQSEISAQFQMQMLVSGVDIIEREDVRTEPTDLRKLLGAQDSGPFLDFATRDMFAQEEARQRAAGRAAGVSAGDAVAQGVVAMGGDTAARVAAVQAATQVESSAAVVIGMMGASIGP